MEKNRRILPAAPDPASGEFLRAKRKSEPVPIGKVEPLVLDFSEFDEEAATRKASRPAAAEMSPNESDTARYSYITNLAQLKAMIARSFAFSRDDEAFDPSAFAEKLVSVGMCTRDKDEPHAYYFLEDRLGNQFRLYMDPAGPVQSRHVDLSRRTIFYFGDQIGHMFPLAFQSDERSR